MKFTKEDFNLENALKKEWIITNGLGGFASSTIIGANTRKYHGLLIAPLTPPAKRYLILSKIDESITIGDNKYDLYTNVGENYISQGYKYQETFENKYLPVFNYKIEDVEISKTVCMQYGKQTVIVGYKIKNSNKKSKLTLAPIINFRDFHSMNTNHTFDIKQKVKGTKVELVIDGNDQYPVYLDLSDGKYTEHKNDIFKDMFYIEEEKRGFYPKENHSVTGIYEVELQPQEEKEIYFSCSLDENKEKINAKKIVQNEKNRINTLIKETETLSNTDKDNKSNDFIEELIKAADQFVVYRPSFKLHTIIAGYPWFLDWGRDSLISFEGLLLKTKRYDIAKEILLMIIKDIKDGLVPNGYSESDNKPLYNSVDASLLLFEQVQKYINYTGDIEFVKENIYSKLESIIENYITGINIDDNNIYLDSDYLIVSGTEKTQNTWMDAKYGDFPATPRNGKAVEINSLWYNSVCIMAELTKKIGNEIDIKKYQDLAKKCKKSFKKEFYNPKRKCLYDVVGDSKIRPNQLFALSLTHQVIEPNSEEAYNIFNTVEKKLLNNYGLKTLAKGEENYIEIYEGNAFKRDMSYHQGITWVWLLGLYYDALKNMIKFEKRKTYKAELEKRLKEFIKKTKVIFQEEIEKRGCIGSIAEIYDSKKPQEPKGAIAQAWSIATIIRITI